MVKKIAFFLILLVFQQTLLAAVQINKVRTWHSPEHTRVVLELSDLVSYKIFQLHKPERVVVEMDNANIDVSTLSSLTNKGALSLVRYAKKGKKELQLIFDLNYPVNPKSFLLKPGQGYSHRLVVDLVPLGNRQQKTAKSSKQEKSAVKKSVTTMAKRDLIVAIDAGHGGEDPGAIGKKGTKEKNVVLAIARRLEKLVNKQPGMQAVMIRNGDYYVSLRNRTKKARKANADVFISIHADAFRNSRARGSSVFILSKRGASSETARWLAAKENSSDLAGGVSLDDKDDLLAKVLLDLSQTATIEGSSSVGDRVLKGLKKIGKTHKNQVERAGFVVLKSPDIPSILVETGFISNYAEEKKLRTSKYQQKLAQAIFNGVNNYFKRYPIPGTIYGQGIAISSTKKNSESKSTRKHKVKRGDTLSRLARKYKTSIKAIKNANKMRNNNLLIGKLLIIPEPRS